MQEVEIAGTAESKLKHLESIADRSGHRSLHARATGRFYTPEVIGRPMARDAAVVLSATKSRSRVISVVDPFCGDGRLVVWLLEECVARGLAPKRWHIDLWDLDERAVAAARLSLTATLSRLHLDADLRPIVCDSFARALKSPQFHMVITNPPWERIKPDRREEDGIQRGAAEQYRADLSGYHKWLADNFQLSRSSRPFSGWGTNLARVGVEVALRITQRGGVTAVVTPPSLMADLESARLREEILTRNRVTVLSTFPAEARLFDGVDQPAMTFVSQATRPRSSEPVTFRAHNRRAVEEVSITRELDFASLKTDEYRLPVGFGLSAVDLLAGFVMYPTFADLETADPQGMWAGREIDETGIASRLTTEGNLRFVKGRNITRWFLHADELRYLTGQHRLPKSIHHARVAWRDVSRPSQKRRMQATLLPAGVATGNSLSVAYFRDDDLGRLAGLLGVMNSIVFEFQLRTRLSTGHVSLSSVRGVRMPVLASQLPTFAAKVHARLAGDLRAEVELEVDVAKAYGLSLADFKRIARCFELDEPELSALSDAWRTTRAVA